MRSLFQDNATAADAAAPAPPAPPADTSASYGDPWGGFMALCYTLAVAAVLGVGVYAVAVAHRVRARNRTVEAFITARGQVSTVRTAWAFFAGALGAWVLAGPGQYAGLYGAGVLGLTMYSLSSGLPVVMVAFAGGAIRRKLPGVLSLTDFMGWRYGYAAKTFVVLLCIFNMSVAMLADYSTVGSIFKAYLGSQAYPIIIVVGVVTMAYTAYGGLLVSIATDQVQGAVALALTLLVGIYMAATFDAPLPKPIPEFYAGTATEDTAAYSYAIGYSSIFTLPASLFTATVFSEAMWQRAWAAEGTRSLKAGALLGAAGICAVVFVIGAIGWLAGWGGLLAGVYPCGTAVEGAPEQDPNLVTFYGLSGALSGSTEYLGFSADFSTCEGSSFAPTGTINNWVGVLVLLLAVVMNAGAVDSLQNGLAGAVSSHLLKNVHLVWTRVAVLAVNVVLIALGTQGYEVLSLFLITNMLCCTSALPVLAGLSERLHAYYGGVSMVASCLLSMFLTSVYGIAECWGDDLTEVFAGVWACVPAADGGSAAGSIGAGLTYTWYRNGYRWQYFLVALGTSAGAVLLFSALNAAAARLGVRLPALPGFTAVATHPELHAAPAGKAGAAAAAGAGAAPPAAEAKAPASDKDSDSQ